jgi:putative transcriptional regulator
MKSIAGHLLVASKFLRDPNFMQSVVLMVQHDKDGALGLVLNRPGDKTVAQVWERIGHDPCDSSQPVYRGGPVPGPLMALHTLEALAELEVLPGLYFSTHRDALDGLVRQETTYRLFAGHSGWGSGQLEGEMDVGGWLTTPAMLDDIWAESDSLWKSVTGRIGLAIVARDIAPDRVPIDPNWN